MKNMFYEGHTLTECINTNKLVPKRSRTCREWQNATAILQRLPLNIHLLLLNDIVADDFFVYRTYTIPGYIGTMSNWLTLFNQDMRADALLQVSRGLQAMHEHGIVHQNLSEDCLHVARNNQFCCGYLIIIGGFERSGSVVLGQSPLNPNRPEPSWDIKAFYDMGLMWKLHEWPLYDNLISYDAWLAMKPVSYRLQPSNLLFLTLMTYKSQYAVARRLYYIMQCARCRFRVSFEEPVQVIASDADLLAICVHLELQATKHPHMANFLYRSIRELMELILWETTEITDLVAFIDTKIRETKAYELNNRPNNDFVGGLNWTIPRCIIC